MCVPKVFMKQKQAPIHTCQISTFMLGSESTSCIDNSSFLFMWIPTGKTKPCGSLSNWSLSHEENFPPIQTPHLFDSLRVGTWYWWGSTTQITASHLLCLTFTILLIFHVFLLFPNNFNTNQIKCLKINLRETKKFNQLITFIHAPEPERYMTQGWTSCL